MTNREIPNELKKVLNDSPLRIPTLEEIMRKDEPLKPFKSSNSRDLGLPIPIKIKEAK
jgi:hypothetical protein